MQGCIQLRVGVNASGDRHDDRTALCDRLTAFSTLTFHTASNLTRVLKQRRHNTIFRHGLNHLALDENLPLAIA